MQVSVSPPGFWGGGHTLACRGASGVTQFRRLDRNSGTLYSIIPLRVVHTFLGSSFMEFGMLTLTNYRLLAQRLWSEFPLFDAHVQTTALELESLQTLAYYGLVWFTHLTDQKTNLSHMESFLHI